MGLISLISFFLFYAVISHLASGKRVYCLEGLMRNTPSITIVPSQHGVRFLW